MNLGLLRIGVTLVVMSVLSSCGSKPANELFLDYDDIHPMRLSAQEGSCKIAVSSDKEWVATIEEAEVQWCSLQNTDGKGKGSVTLNYTENDTPESRTVRFVVRSGNAKASFPIIQESLKEKTVKVLYHNIFLRKYESQSQTYKLWSYRKSGIIEMIYQQSPDIFGLNECDWQQRSDLASSLPQYTVLGICTDGTDRNYTNASNPIYYKTDDYDCFDWGTFWLSDTPDEASYTWEPVSGGPLNQRRNCTWAKLRHRISGKTFIFAVTHLANDNIGANSRRKSIPLIVSRLTQLSQGIPVILGGDFNCDLPKYPDVAAPLLNVMLDARSNCKATDTGMTYNAFSEPQGKSILDHIFYSGMQGVVFGVDRNPYEGITYISDHFPVFTTLIFE